MRKIIIITLIFCFNFTFSQKKWKLQDCVNYAIVNNLQVKNGEYNQSIQEKSLEIAKRNYLPQVTGSISNSSNFGQSQDVFGNIRRNDNFNSNLNVGGNVLLYNAGRLKKNTQKSNYDLEATQQDLESIKNNISLQIAQQYLQILLNKEIYKISESAVNNAQKVYERAKKTTEVGTTPLTLQYEAQASLARQKQNLQSAQIEIERSLFQMSVLLQLEDYKDFDVEDAPKYDNISANNLQNNEVIETAYKNQPQIKAAEQRLLSAKMQTQIERTNLMPTLSASAGLGSFYFNSLVTSTEQAFLQQVKNNFSQQLGLNLSIPIFNKGITKLQIEQAKINELNADNAILLRKQEIKQNVQKAYFDANSAYQNYLAAVEAEKSTKLALDFSEKSYEVGRATIYDLTNSRNNWVNAKGSVSQSKFNYIFALKLLQFYSGVPLSLD